MVEEIVEGSTCRRPGPSLSGSDEFEGIGKRSGDIASPGRTIVSVAIDQCFSCLYRQSSTILTRCSHVTIAGADLTGANKKLWCAKYPMHWACLESANLHDDTQGLKT